MRTLLIDTDTASDDAVALIMALRSRDVRVAAITVVAGIFRWHRPPATLCSPRSCADQTCLCFPARKRRCSASWQTADWFHGADGLGDHGYKPAKRRAETLHAVDALIQTIRENPGIEMVTLGPLTNVAMSLLREPKLAASVKRCVVMGGAPCCEGNVTPAAEFNIWVDPEAARIVFCSGLKLEMVGWQLSRGDAVIHPPEIERILALKNPVSDFAVRSNSTAIEAFFTQTGERGICLPDPVAMGIALRPALCTASSEHYVEIETRSELTRGTTVVDRLNVATDSRNRGVWAETIERQRKVHVCWSLDIPKWKDLLFPALA